MHHFLEVLKILDGAVNADRAKVLAYAEQLASKLEAEGDLRSAEGVRRSLRSGKAKDLTLSRAAALPVDSESRLSLADETVISPEEVQLVLDPAVEMKIVEFVQFARASDELAKAGVGAASSLLLYGPPGCGKTALARRIAADLSLPLLTARSDSLISSFLGSTSKNIRMLFEHAMARPCVLFLDEFDALAKLRDDQHELGELKRVVVSLLQNIDALDSHTVIVAATNHEHLLDPAIWRRFALHLKIEKPSAPMRESLLRMFLGASLPEELDSDALADAAVELSGAQIRLLCEDARRSAIVKNAGRVSPSDLLLRVLEARTPGLHSMPVPQRISHARHLSKKLFTVRRLSEVFGISTGAISTLLRRQEEET